MRRETSGANFVYATPRFAILVHFFTLLAPTHRR